MSRYENRYSLASAIFEYIATNDICSINELADNLTISRDSIAKTIDILIMFGLLEYDDNNIKVSKRARVILD